MFSHRQSHIILFNYKILQWDIWVKLSPFYPCGNQVPHDNSKYLSSIYHVLNAILKAIQALIHLIFTTIQWYSSKPHLREEELSSPCLSHWPEVSPPLRGRAGGGAPEPLLSALTLLPCRG